MCHPNHVFFLISTLYLPELRLPLVTMPLKSDRAKQTSIHTRIATDINRIAGVCRGGLGVWTLSTNCIPINSQNQAVFAFLSLKRVPFSIAESSGSSGLVCGCYPTGTIVNMKQDLNQQDTGKYLGEFFHI